MRGSGFVLGACWLCPSSCWPRDGEGGCLWGEGGVLVHIPGVVQPRWLFPRGCLWVQGGSGGGPRFPFPQRTLSQGQAGWCCAFGGQEQVLLWSGPDPTSTGAVLAPAPGLPVVGLCRRCCMGVLGVFSQLLALARSPGEKFLVSRPHVSLPSHCGCVAPARFCRKPRGGAGQSCPCPGGSRFAGAAALGLFGLSCAAGS